MGATDNQPNDIPPEAGERPPFDRPVDAEAESQVGTGEGYSGQEYDSAGQAEWRAEQARHQLPASGEVHGSGAGAGGGNPGEDYDSDSTAGDGYLQTGADGEGGVVAAVESGDGD
jgi:hypothetical protein